MDHAKTLIRSVARAFHDVRHIIVVDALMVHSALSIDDLHHLTSMQQKDIRKLLGRLREDRLVSVQTRQEVKGQSNSQRPMHRDYYYINYHASIDAIKFRIFHVTKKINDAYKPQEEKKDYFCPRCKARWTQLEVIDNFRGTGFHCHRCDGLLRRDEDSAADMAGHKTQSRLMSQIEPILNLLKQIDEEEIPQNDFATALSMAIPVDRDRETHPINVDAATDIQQEIKTTKAKAETGPDVKVELVNEEGAKAAEEEAKRQKAQQEAQNALPSWYTHSTIDNTSVNGSLANGTIKNVNAVKDEEEEKKALDIKQNAEMDAYFALVKQEQERERAAVDQDDDEDDDEEDFEDVDIASAIPSGLVTPGSEMSGSGHINGNGKRKVDDDEPTMSGALGDSDSPSKKVKLDGNAIDSNVSTPADRDSDEDEEFEDVS